MNRIIVLSITIMMCISMYAFDGRKVHFVYIAHDVETPIYELKGKLDFYRDEAREDSNYQVIFYLANQWRPIIVQINPVEYNENDYKSLIQELYERDYHTPQPDVDVEYIVELFKNLQISGKDSGVEELTMSYFVTPNFFIQGYNEAVIARLYYVLDIENLCSENKVGSFTLDALYPKGYKPEYSDGEPFGPMNLGLINDRCKNSIKQM